MREAPGIGANDNYLLTGRQHCAGPNPPERTQRKSQSLTILVFVEFVSAMVNLPSHLIRACGTPVGRPRVGITHGQADSAYGACAQNNSDGEATVPMRLLLQSAIIFAVVASNIHWQWTPNGYLVGLAGVGAAFAVTAAVNWVVDWFRRPPR